MNSQSWVVLGLMALVGCTSAATNTADSPTSTASDETVAIAAVSPPTSANDEEESATTAAATVATTSPATTVPVDPCADFEALQGYERMMAVKEGAAPTEPACRAVVDRSRLALNTYEVALSFSEAYAKFDRDDLMVLDTCSEPATLLNLFEVPVIYWGVTRVLEYDVVISYRPFITEVIQPGAAAPVPIPGEGGDGRTCQLSFEGIVAPVGGLAAGVDAPPAPADDPLNSDDPQVWGRELLDREDYSYPMDEMVNRVEDLHSGDLGDHLRTLEEPSDDEDDERPEVYTLTICSAEPTELGPDIAGEYSWLIYDVHVADGSWRQIGLFSRGVDRRWRFLGTVRLIDETDASTETCDVPPLT